MSIRQWLGSGYRGVITQSRDIGYQNIHYANGIYVAVGNQKGYLPFVNQPTAGQPVTCAGCSWSTDGLNWTDAVMPFDGTAYSYCYLAAIPDRWVAVSRWSIDSDNSASVYSRVAVSTDNAKTWTAEAPVLWNCRGIAAGNGRFAHFGTASPGGQNAARYTTTGFLAAATTQNRPNPGFVAGTYMGDNDRWFFMTADRVDTVNLTGAVGWQSWNNPGYGSGLNAPDNYRDPRDLLLADYGVLGSVAAPTAWALVGIYNPFVPAITRDIWSSGPTNFGTVWTKRATLPAINASTDYWNLAYNGRVLAAIGDGILVVTKDGTNWTRIDIPAGRWRGVASDGNDFVCVSQSGDRLKISGAGIDGRIG
jgi:hypothetical protein